MVLPLIGEVKSAAGGRDGLRVSAIFGVHGRQHLQNLRLLDAGKFGGLLELRQGVSKVSFRGQDPAKVVTVIRRIGCECDRFLDMLSRLVQIAAASK